MNKISWKKKATKQLSKLEVVTKGQVYLSVQALVNFPNCENVKKLTNSEFDYRLRVGNYRVLFNFNGEVKIVSIEGVKKRDEHTY